MKTSRACELSAESTMRDIVDALPGVVYQFVYRPGCKGEFSFFSEGVKALLGVTPEEVYRDIRVLTAHIHPEDRRRFRELTRAASLKRMGNWSFEFRVVVPGEGEKWVHSSAKPQRHPSGVVSWNGVMLEMPNGRTPDADLKPLGIYDQLTGLYNRAYFESEIAGRDRRTSRAAAVIVCDIDGLRFINDTFGHAEGNKLLAAAANIIKASLRDGDLAARIGEDEFVAVLPGAAEQEADNIAYSIREAIVNYGLTNFRMPFSIAVGCAVSGKDYPSLIDVYKAADDSMCREKLHHVGSRRSKIIQALVTALEARDHMTDGHASRLQSMALMLAMAVGLPENRYGDLRLLALFHDIGKVAIPDEILFKPSALGAEERVIMRQHCQIGQRLAMSLPDLEPIADWILKHHEWWNGSGYPLGLRGEEIPLECRITAIVDAYDAMTNDRPYRSAMNHREAVAEIRKHSGSQFDAALVDQFINLLEGQSLQ